MLEWTTAGKAPVSACYVHHTDADREWAYDRAVVHLAASTRGRSTRAEGLDSPLGNRLVDDEKTGLDETVFKFLQGHPAGKRRHANEERWLQRRESVSPGIQHERFSPAPRPAAAGRPLAPSVLAPGKAHSGQEVDASVLPFPPTPMDSVAKPRLQDSTMKWPADPQRLPADAPNVLIVLIDDIGFGVADTFGGEVHTPTLTRLAQAGYPIQRVSHNVDLLANSCSIVNRTQPHKNRLRYHC